MDAGSRRGLSGFEFLLTYGWVILVVLVVGFTLSQLNGFDLSRFSKFSYSGFTRGVVPLMASGQVSEDLAEAVIVFNNAGATDINIVNINVYTPWGGGLYNDNSTYCTVAIKLIGEQEYINLSNPSHECEEISHGGITPKFLSVLSNALASPQGYEATHFYWRLLATPCEAAGGGTPGGWGDSPDCACLDSCLGYGEYAGKCDSTKKICCHPCAHPPCDQDCHPIRVYKGQAFKIPAHQLFAIKASDGCGFDLKPGGDFVEMAVHISYFTDLGLGGNEIQVYKTSGIVRGIFEEE